MTSFSCCVLALVVGIVVAACVEAGDAPAPADRPLIGAIRWDAWHTPWSKVRPGHADGPVRAMEISLAPKQYHYRLPFFAKVVSDKEVKIDGYTQATVDQEIAYAKAGGIDYWAFLLYAPDSSMSQGLSLYLSSSRKQDVRFCAIAGPEIFGDAQVFRERMQRLLKLMAEPSYLKVAGNRPLLYVFRVTDEWLGKWGGRENARRLFDDFRAAVKAAGHGDPYLVAMNDNAPDGKKMADAIGAEAITAYAIFGHGGNNGTPYAQLADAARTFWKACAATGAQVVPLATAGWDRRPRIEHPVPWEKWQQPGAGMEKYYQVPAPQELAAHLEDAMRFCLRNKERCPAQAIIVYAWNEHDEGGWLCPTLNPDGSPNTERLDAIAAMLKAFKP
ncbi:MAG: hypothetical protein NTW87_28310 [Planctomycetota bacterium]|nr:hypothetical protein [Planctomycetota bacterium]